MKTSTFFTCVVLLLLVGAMQLGSQTPQGSQPSLPPPAIAAEVRLAQTAKALDQANLQIKQAVQTLQAIKTANEQLLDKQQKALEKLDALQKEADQVRILGRRN